MRDIQMPEWFWMVDCAVILILTVYVYTKISWFFDTAWHRKPFIKNYFLPCCNILAGFLLVVHLICAVPVMMGGIELVYVRALVYVSVFGTAAFIGTIQVLCLIVSNTLDWISKQRKKILSKRKPMW